MNKSQYFSTAMLNQARSYKDSVSLIENASLNDARVILLAECAKSEEFAKEAAAMLDKMHAARWRLPLPAAAAGTKRKATTDMAVCADCKEVYASGEDQNNDCVYHPGKEFELTGVLPCGSCKSQESWRQITKRGTISTRTPDLLNTIGILS